MQNQAVAQDLVHLHSDVRHILGNGLDPFNEAGPRGEPRGEGRARGEPMNSPCLPMDSEQRPQQKPDGREAELASARLTPQTQQKSTLLCESLLCLLCPESVRYSTWD